MISKLRLKNFRCFNDFTLNEICPVTLIAGANNVGKSTILESIYLFMDRYSNGVFQKINSFRGVYEGAFSPDLLWELLFKNKDISVPLEVSVVNYNDTEEQTLSFIKDESMSISTESHIANQLNLFPSSPNNYPLKMTFNNGIESEISFFIINNGNLTLARQETRMVNASNPPVNIRYIGSHTFVRLAELTELFGVLELNRKTSECVKVLQTLEPRINYLTTVTTRNVSSLFTDIGLPTLVSFNVLGDGINKLMLILLEMLAHPGSILLIDEIENGFHYSFYPKMWEIIGALAKETGCQVIATTHSYECIKEATVLSFTAEADLFKFIRLDRIDGSIIPKCFDNDSFAYAIANDLEVR
jgi:AAA15 family ATPase/GTPase